jgi:hypothetical protein
MYYRQISNLGEKVFDRLTGWLRWMDDGLQVTYVVEENNEFSGFRNRTLVWRKDSMLSK